MTTADPHTDIANRALAVVDARLALVDAIRESCPGPHLLVQHRDRKPAWCEACGYADDGARIKERP